MPDGSRWTATLRRLDRLPAGPAIAIGLACGGMVGVLVAISPHPAAQVAFVVVLVTATVLALTAEPVLDERATRVRKEPVAGEEWENPVDGSVLVYVPSGEYVLGAEDLEDLFSAEIAARSKPVHQVRLTGFWMGKFAVTNAQYRRFLEANQDQRKPQFWNDERFNGDDQPVVGVSWDEARAYCEWAGLELPSEAQWEAAARGDDQRRYPWGDEPPAEELATFGQEWQTGRPTPVGRKAAGAGPFGTLDQAGNVWEWCADAWDPKAYDGRDGQLDPVAMEGQEGVRVVRGGSWSNPATFLASAFRSWNGSSYRYPYLGFRCVVSTPPER